MDENLFESLIYESEGSTLDFKVEQYPFDEADKRKKSELLKDILAFANAWRESDAYILIGVEEHAGKKNIVKGISEHIDDAKLQQFVNQKTNKPITFSYSVFDYHGKQIGVVRIPVQERPFYLKKDFGKLEKEKVYLRRGSSTDIASIEEITKMGKEFLFQENIPALTINFANSKSHIEFAKHLELKGKMIFIPDGEMIPRMKLNSPNSIFGGNNSKYYIEYYEYYLMNCFFQPIGFVVKNDGEVLAKNVTLRFSIMKTENIAILSAYDILKPPDYYGISVPAFRKMLPVSRIISTSVNEVDDNWEIEVNCGDIQPKAKVWTQEFFIGVNRNLEMKIDIFAFANNLPNPNNEVFLINWSFELQTITVDELMKIANENIK